MAQSRNWKWSSVATCSNLVGERLGNEARAHRLPNCAMECVFPVPSSAEDVVGRHCHDTCVTKLTCAGVVMQQAGGGSIPR